jgi:HD superfamily phosphohydrolase
LISLNFDGLTKRAVESVAEELMATPPEKRRTARVLSSVAQIRAFFTGLETEEAGAEERPSETHNKLPWHPVPIIKFRGDVFHAVCENGRCPEFQRPSALYELLDLAQEEAVAKSERAAPAPEKADPEETAGRLLRCGSCGRHRQLEISFPGVYGKERGIDEALAAFHEVFGRGVAGVVFLGFSGTWDEALVNYLVGRAKALRAPILTLGRSPTPAIEDACSGVGVSYGHATLEAASPDADAILETVLGSRNAVSAPPRFCSPAHEGVEFPGEGFSLLPEKDRNSFALRLPGGAGSCERSLSIASAVDHDGFTDIAGYALHTEALVRLQRCSQLGLKGDFVREDDPRHHSRYFHSAAAAMVAMLWYEALLPQRGQSRTWAWTQESRTALELAVLFHDAKHLPFSHMMEEVFQELNWGQIPALSWPDIPRYTKDVKPDFTQFGDKLKLTLAQAGVSVDDVAPWWEKVTALQEGLSGIPWLEAIVDSALDADKIEYLFHDTMLTQQNVRLTDWQTWFEAFLSGQSLTPEGMIRLEGQSCLAALELLQERLHLYRRLYLAPELRALECLAKYIVLTWLKWKIPDELELPDREAYDLDHSLRAAKSETAGRLLWKTFARHEPPPGRELAGLGEMVDELKGTPHLDGAAVQWLGGLGSSGKLGSRTGFVVGSHV